MQISKAERVLRILKKRDDEAMKRFEPSTDPGKHERWRIWFEAIARKSGQNPDDWPRREFKEFGS